ncbi:MAG: TldD/PmbA family protein [Alphaproteobacteria bacterium]
MHDDPRNLLDTILKQARAQGADAVDLMFRHEESRSARVRLGKIESVDASETAELGLRLFLGKRQALVATTDFSPAACTALLERAVNMAQLAPEDPYCGLAETTQLPSTTPALDIFDPTEASADDLVALARTTEAAALAVSGVTNTEEAEAGWSRSALYLLQSNGFSGHYRRSYFAASVAAVAGKDTAMERDYDYSSAVHRADLLPAAEIGSKAGTRAVRRLNARKMPTGKIPVVFEPRIAASLLGHLISAINGASIARRTSFLQGDLGKQIFPSGFTVIDDPHRSRGLRSRPFDVEGIATAPRNLIADGVLTSWLLDLRSARQLGMASTGHASRGVGSPPGAGASNCFIGAGKLPPANLIRDIREGFYVTELIGMGVNGITGDYSRGAAGFWIENGQITHPVNEMTIAGNLRAMFRHMTAANDLELRQEREAPTLRIDGMTVAGL